MSEEEKKQAHNAMERAKSFFYSKYNTFPSFAPHNCYCQFFYAPPEVMGAQLPPGQTLIEENTLKKNIVAACLCPKHERFKRKKKIKVKDKAGHVSEVEVDDFSRCHEETWKDARAVTDKYRGRPLTEEEDAAQGDEIAAAKRSVLDDCVDKIRNGTYVEQVPANPSENAFAKAARDKMLVEP